MEKTPLVVCAIDIGRDMSGHSFSYSHEFDHKPLTSRIKNWLAGTSCLITSKTPTCVLIKPDGKTLDSFGYDAQNRYFDLAEQGEHKSYFFFQTFRLALDKKLCNTISSTLTLEDEMGRSLPALDILAMSIKFFVDDIIATCSNYVSGIEKRDILFVLTVSTIWHDDGKTFMREAAVMAGVERKQLLIVLESEVVLPFFLNLSKRIDVPFELSQAGSKFMVLDAGGTSVDITVNEIGKSGEITEIHAWSIDGCGSKNVNASLENMISSIVSKEVYDKFKQEEIDDWTNLSRDFESRKPSFRFETEMFTVKIPSSLKESYQTQFKGTIADRISKSKFKGEIKWMSDRMRISAKVFKSLFNESMQTIIGHVKGILRDRHVTSILMVGGYSESSMLQHAVKSAFPDSRVVIPLDPSLAVLKGALIYGHTQKSEKNILVQIHDVIDGSDFLRSQNDGSDFINEVYCTPCSDDYTNVEAEYHCVKCQTYFCSTCVTYHNRVFKTHKLLGKDEQGFNQGHQHPQSSSDSSSLKDTCEIHAREVVKMYCQQHDIVCCTVCIALEHRACTGVHYIPDIAKGLLKPNEDRNTLTSLKQMKSDLGQLVSKRKSEMSVADKRLDCVVNEITNVKAGIIQKAEKLEKASIAKVQRLHGSFTDGINADIKSLENTMEGIDKKISEMDRKNIKDETELFLRVKQSQNQIRNGCECRKSQYKDVTQISFEIDTDIAKNLDKHIDFLK